MKILLFISAILFFVGSSLEQDLYITFTGTGESTVVDSVTATNLATGEYVTLPGDETLVLSSGGVGIEDLAISDEVKLFPNPFYNTATLVVNQPYDDRVDITVQNLIGQTIMQSSQYLEAGDHSFTVSLQEPGIYLVNINKKNMGRSFKAVSLESGPPNRLEYNGLSTKAIKTGFLKSGGSNYTLHHTSGDIIHYSGMSGKYTTIFTDSTDVSQNYEFEFADCTDSDGNNYSMVKIGTQIWMAENLKSTKYNDDTAIPFVPGVTAWIVTTNPAYCWQENDEGKNKATYGALYNWHTVNTGKLCPTGWHIPTDSEWYQLVLFLDPEAVINDPSVTQVESLIAGGKLKETGTIHWISTNTGATNESGFTALPGGHRDFRGMFFGLGRYGFWWSSTDYSTFYAWLRNIYHGNNEMKRSNVFPKAEGLSVRCIKDE